jgi:hypothetical protein
MAFEIHLLSTPRPDLENKLLDAGVAAISRGRVLTFVSKKDRDDAVKVLRKETYNFSVPPIEHAQVKPTASTSRSLVELSLSGQSAQHIIDSLLEELPPLPMLYNTIRRELKNMASVRIDENAVFIKSNDKSSKQVVRENVNYLQLVYPELEFVVE